MVQSIQAPGTYRAMSLERLDTANPETVTHRMAMCCLDTQG